MIEIICDGDDDKGEKNETASRTGIRKPKNIKQIGDVSSGKQIYIEDYAFTYINSIAYNNCLGEQAGVLLGEFQRNEEEKCVFIKGVVKAHAFESDTGICFDENVWNGIYTDIEKYFPNLQVVGWFAILPQVMESDMRRLKKIHIDHFSGNMKVMYLVDASEREENFYLYDKEELKKQKGYVCFYERNCEMQEYMLERKVRKSSEESNDDKVMKSIRNVIHEKEEVKQQKRNVTFTYGITALMVAAVLVTGISLMNNYQKMQNFDRSIKQLSAQVSGDNSDTDENQLETKLDGDSVVSVNKLEGNVYPTTAKETEQTTQMTTSVENISDSGSTKAKDDTTVKETQAAKESATLYTEYIVKEGDSIMSICKKHYGTINRYEDVLELNQLEDPNMLYVGQVVKLP